MTENRLARKDGKIVVVARSVAIAKRRGNLAKSLSGGGERLLRLLARNDGRCGNDSDRIKPNICFCFTFYFKLGLYHRY